MYGHAEVIHASDLNGLGMAIADITNLALPDLTLPWLTWQCQM